MSQEILFPQENSTPDNHALYVWDNFVANAKAAHIAIVAHSYGGVVTTNLVSKKKHELHIVVSVTHYE